MKECPIIFSGPMVRAILDGRKTQTRRILKRPTHHFHASYTHAEGFVGKVLWWDGRDRNDGMMRRMYCCVGDLLWVRESFADTAGMGFDDRFHYKADCISADADEIRKQYGVKWKPSIHMPRWASRITLKVAGVKVERLQDISRGDAMDEGCPHPNMQDGPNPRDWFSTLWGSIHGPGSWEANPWVCAITFERVQP